MVWKALALQLSEGSGSRSMSLSRSLSCISNVQRDSVYLRM